VKIYIFIVIISIASSGALAQKSSGMVHLIYIPGVGSTLEKTQEGFKKLKEVIQSDSRIPSLLNIQVQENPSRGYFFDLSQAASQAKDQLPKPLQAIVGVGEKVHQLNEEFNQSRVPEREVYFQIAGYTKEEAKALANMPPPIDSILELRDKVKINTDNGEPTMLLSSSQGGLIVNEAMKGLNSSYCKSVVVIQVATPTSYVACGGQYITGTDDIINLVPGTKRTGNVDHSGHSFHTYLENEETKDKILNAIASNFSPDGEWQNSRGISMVGNRDQYPSQRPSILKEGQQILQRSLRSLPINGISSNKPERKPKSKIGRNPAKIGGSGSSQFQITTRPLKPLSVHLWPDKKIRNALGEIINPVSPKNYEDSQ